MKSIPRAVWLRSVWIGENVTASRRSVGIPPVIGDAGDSPVRGEHAADFDWAKACPHSAQHVAGRMAAFPLLAISGRRLADRGGMILAYNDNRPTISHRRAS